MVPEERATPEPDWAPASTTVMGVVAASDRCMDRVTFTLPWASGAVEDWDPVRVLVKGTDGTLPLLTAPFPLAVPFPVATAPLPVALAPFLAASWASSAEDVPERWDQPGRRGPRAAKPAIARVRTSAPMPAAARFPMGRVRPVVNRQASAASTAAVHVASTKSTTGSWVSVPLPRPWSKAIGQHR